MFERWWVHAERHYLSLPERGHPEWLAFYYDPIIDHVHRGSPQIGLYVALYLVPQKPEVARRLFDWAAATYRWSATSGDIRPVRDPRVYALGLVLANELGDATSYARLREHVERTCEPQWDRECSEFTWGFGLGEPIPRGQLNGTIMMAETGGAGAWSRIFQRPNLEKFAQPTVGSVDYPTVGISRAWYDADRQRFRRRHLRGRPRTPRGADIVPCPATHGSCACSRRVRRLPVWRVASQWARGDHRGERRR